MSSLHIPRKKCSICSRTIAKNHRHIHCIFCNSDVHIKCNNTDPKTYYKIKDENLSEICSHCLSENTQTIETLETHVSVASEHNPVLTNHMPKIQCRECNRTIAKTHRYINCQLCSANVHIKCNLTDPKVYNNMIEHSLPQFCKNCQNDCEVTETLPDANNPKLVTDTAIPCDMPFQQLTNLQFIIENKTQNIEVLPLRAKMKCIICKKTIAKNHRHLNCESCKSQVHIKCNETDEKTYKQIIQENLPQNCILCSPKPPIIKNYCEICTKRIGKNHKFIQCSSCNGNVHIKCNKIDLKTYKAMGKDELLICTKCQSDNIPFQNLTDLQFLAASKDLKTDTEVLEEVSVTSTSLRTFFQEINKSSPFEHLDSDEDDDNATLINCKYTDLCSFKHKPSKNKFSLLHTNIGSLSKHKEELEVILNMLDFKFDVIGITETKLSKNSPPKFDINLTGYKCFHVDTEAAKGGSLIYVSDTIDSKERHDLQSLLYKSEVLESTFIEINNPRKKNILVGCIYRHPSMDLNEFNSEYWTPFLETLSKEDKKNT